MKKGAIGVLLMVVVSCILFSCNSQKSLQELLQEERKAIDRFIGMNDLKPLQNYPKDGVFKENEYFKTPEGLFLNVVDSGNGTRAKLLNDVAVRFDYLQYVKDAAAGDTTKSFSNPYFEPYSFVYGISQTYSSYSSPVCQAWVIPLSYVGEGAVVNLIVPSKFGSYSDNSSITPVFYRNLRYTRFN